MDSDRHIPVLLAETIRLLSPQPGDVVVDCTLGLGGHSIALARAIGPKGHVIGFDLDPANLAHAKSVIEPVGPRLTAINANFTAAPADLRKLNLQANIVLADLGFSSNQMDDPTRGFSFSADGPLDMRIDPNSPLTAADLVADLHEKQLADIIYQYGEEPYARKIARKLVQNRQQQPIRSTAELARLVVDAYGPRAHSSRTHPATRTFMALRIAVNDELGSLKDLLASLTQGAEQVNGASWLQRGARIAIISFHSLEDRLVKQAFADLDKRGLAMRLTKKPITATDEEIRSNPRSRSAKLRAVRIGDPSQP